MKQLGSHVWTDLTVDNATEIRDFYKSVVGWDHMDHDMNGYNDYVMLPNSQEEGGEAFGICHARGANANIPPQWLIYVTVEDITIATSACVDNGGKVVEGPRKMAGKDFAVIQDPAGAYMAIITE